MPIKKKLSKSKRLLSKSKRLSKSKSRTKKISKSKVKPKYKYNKKNNMNTLKNSNKNSNKNFLAGGFFGDSSCNIATVKEPGFNVAGFGTGANTIAGLSIPESRAVIYNPNCSNSTSKYQAMVPG
jgi:hypothetical protein